MNKGFKRGTLQVVPLPHRIRKHISFRGFRSHHSDVKNIHIIGVETDVVSPNERNVKNVHTLPWHISPRKGCNT